MFEKAEVAFGARTAEAIGTGAGTLAGAAAGAMIGVSIGIALGPGGAIAGTGALCDYRRSVRRTRRWQSRIGDGLEERAGILAGPTAPVASSPDPAPDRVSDLDPPRSCSRVYAPLRWRLKMMASDKICKSNKFLRTNSGTQAFPGPVPGDVSTKALRRGEGSSEPRPGRFAGRAAA